MTDAASFHEEEALGKAYDARLMRRLLRYLRRKLWAWGVVGDGAGNARDGAAGGGVGAVHINFVSQSSRRPQ